MYTQCPDCSTAFRVTASVLKQAAGKVRCGGCGSAFNALEFLSETTPEQVVAREADTPLPELTAEPHQSDDGSPVSISAEQSAALLKTLDELAGSDIRIEDTGVEWRVLDEDELSAVDVDELLEESPTPVDEFLTKTPNDVEAREIFEESANAFAQTPVEELRFDDDTPLPDDFDLDDESSYLPESTEQDQSALEADDDSEAEQFDETEESQIEVSLGEPEEWADILGDFDELAEPFVAPLEAELAAIEDADEPPEADKPPDVDTQFALQAEAMGIDLSSLHLSPEHEVEEEFATEPGDESGQQPAIEVVYEPPEEVELELDDELDEEPAIEADDEANDEPEIELGDERDEEPAKEVDDELDEEMELEIADQRDEEPAKEVGDEPDEEVELVHDEEPDEELAIETDDASDEESEPELDDELDQEPAIETDDASDEETEPERDDELDEEPAIEARVEPDEEAELVTDEKPDDELAIKADDASDEDAELEHDIEPEDEATRRHSFDEEEDEDPAPLEFGTVNKAMAELEEQSNVFDDEFFNDEDAVKLEDEEEHGDDIDEEEPDLAADQETGFHIPPQTEEEQTLNMMIDEDLLSLAVEDEDGFASTIVIAEKDADISGIAEKERLSEDVNISADFESIVMEGEFVHTALDKEKREADIAAAAELTEKAKAARDAEKATPAGGRSRGMIAAVIALTFLLAMQLMHQSREALATIPAFNSVLGPVYRAIGKPLSPAWDVTGWTFEATQPKSDDNDEQLTVLSRIGNRSEDPLPYPLINIALIDRFEETIGSQTLDPADYLANNFDPSTLIQPGNTFTAVISVPWPAEDATGYKLKVCYRLSAGRLRCNNPDFR